MTIRNVCVCVCVMLWYETEQQRELGCLQKLIHPINHSIWFLFIFRSPTVIPASHWALYALPRRFPPNHRAPCSVRSAVIWRGLGFQHFSDISRFLNFMAKSPQTCLSSKPRRADVQVYRLHTYADLCQRSRLVLSDCKHSLGEWNYVSSTTIWQMEKRAKCRHAAYFHLWKLRVKIKKKKFLWQTWPVIVQYIHSLKLHLYRI